MKLKRLHARVENRAAKVDLESHMQETCSHMSRDLDKAVRKALLAKDSSSRKAKALRNQRPSTILLDMSQRREQGQLLLQYCTTNREEKNLHVFLRIKGGFVKRKSR